MAEIKTINNIPLADTTARDDITNLNEKISQLSDEIAFTQLGNILDRK